MDIKQALKKLSEKNVTSSIQVLRRWLRQGKIKAVKESNKGGWNIDKNSLNSFIKHYSNNKNSPVRVVEKELEVEKVPDDYHYFKGNFESLKAVNKRLQDENKQIRKELKEYSSVSTAELDPLKGHIKVQEMEIAALCLELREHGIFNEDETESDIIRKSLKEYKEQLE